MKMTVKELYEKLNASMPEELREAWDNDGLMCCADSSAEVYRVLVSLDVTDGVIDYAIEGDFDLIISHHPLVFKPISALTDENHISRKLIRLISSGISVMSFHTRADKAEGGVNDILADMLGIFNTVPFADGIGRIGEIDEECCFEEFAESVKIALGADTIRTADAYNSVKRVAVLGGDGKSGVMPALALGADTYISGRIGYNVMEEAAEMGINLIEAGHFFTEQPVCTYFKKLVGKAAPDVYVEIANSNVIKSL